MESSTLSPRCEANHSRASCPRAPVPSPKISFLVFALIGPSSPLLLLQSPPPPQCCCPRRRCVPCVWRDFYLVMLVLRRRRRRTGHNSHSCRGRAKSSRPFISVAASLAATPFSFSSSGGICTSRRPRLAAETFLQMPLPASGNCAVRTGNIRKHFQLCTGPLRSIYSLFLACRRSLTTTAANQEERRQSTARQRQIREDHLRLVAFTAAKTRRIFRLCIVPRLFQWFLCLQNSKKIQGVPAPSMD